jgi:hypothetical protein
VGQPSKSALPRLRVGRIVTLTLGLSAVGAIVGAAAGALALLLALILGGTRMDSSDFVVLAIPAILGAFLGTVLTPIAAWMLLRSVPLGRAFLGLAAGTIVGGVLGWFFLRAWYSLEGAVVAAVVGFVIAAIVLRRTPVSTS